MERYDFDIPRLRLRDPVAIFTPGYNPFEGQPVEVDGKLLKPGRLFQALAKIDQGVADAYEAAFEQGHRLWMFNPDIVSMVGEPYCWGTTVGLSWYETSWMRYRSVGTGPRGWTFPRVEHRSLVSMCRPGG